MGVLFSNGHEAGRGEGGQTDLSGDQPLQQKWKHAVHQEGNILSSVFHFPLCPLVTSGLSPFPAPPHLNQI